MYEKICRTGKSKNIHRNTKEKTLLIFNKIMLDTEYKQILNEVLDENKYLCLSTSDIEGNPWASPLVYVRDADYNFYFLSHTLSRHCKNIEKNNKVAFSVFNSKQNVGIAF